MDHLGLPRAGQGADDAKFAIQHNIEFGKHLAEFGEKYARYAAKTPRFFPGLGAA